MRFYIYYRPLETIRFGEYMGDLIHISTEEKDYCPDGKIWKVKRCNRPENVYTRLIKMLKHGGMEGDMVYPLDGNRSLKDLVKYMNQWENKNDTKPYQKAGPCHHRVHRNPLLSV